MSAQIATITHEHNKLSSQLTGFTISFAGNITNDICINISKSPTVSHDVCVGPTEVIPNDIICWDGIIPMDVD